MSQLTTHPYVTTDPRILSGEPIIAGTRTPIRAIVELWRMGVAPKDVPTAAARLTGAGVRRAQRLL